MLHKKILFLLIILGILFIGFSSETQPDILVEEAREGVCPEGYSASVYFDGAEFSYGDCQRNSLDTGNVCKSSQDCAFECTFDHDDAIELCSESVIAGSGACYGITGMCDAISEPFPSYSTIPEENTIRLFRAD